MDDKPPRQFTSWIRRLQFMNLLREKSRELRGLLIDDESANAVALDDMLEQVERLRSMLVRERNYPGERRKIEGDLAEVIDAMKPLLDKFRRSSRGRLPQMREIASEINDLLEELR